MDKYFIKPPFNSKPKLLVKIQGEWINLKGEDTSEMITPMRGGPKQKIEIKGATQVVLENLYENPELYGNFSKIIGKTENSVEKPASLFAERKALQGSLFGEEENISTSKKK
jgi:hypothetical protein